MSRGHTLPQAEFGELFQELLTTRARYEALRMGGAPFGQRAELLARLHALRSTMGQLRNS